MENAQSRTEAQPKYNPVAIVKFLASNSVFSLAGYLCGACMLPFGALPFGFAILCSAAKNAVFVYIGLVVSCFNSPKEEAAFLLLGIYTALLLLRVLVRLTLDCPFPKKSRRTFGEIASVMFGESPILRVCVCAVGAVSFSLVYTVMGGFTYYDLLGLLLSALLAPLACLLFYRFFDKSGVFSEIGFLALCAVCMYAAVPLKLYGTSLAVLGGLFTVFYVTHKKGFVRGLIASVVVGLVYSPVLAPIFIFSALCSGIFMKISPSLACFAAFFASVGWGYYIRGVRILDGILSGVLCACVLYSALSRFYTVGTNSKKTEVKSDKTEAGTTVCRPLGESELDGIRLFEMNRRMSALCDGLERLSTFFEQIKLRFPKRAELLKICNEAFDSSCAGCSEYRRCRACGEGNIERQTERICSLLESNRSVSTEDIDRELDARCARLPDIIDEINYNSGVHLSAGEMFSKDFAPDYKALSKLLGKSMEEEAEEYKTDRELSAKLCPLLNELECDIEGVLVYGRQKPTVFIKGKSAQTLKQNKEKILQSLVGVLPFEIDSEGVKVRKSADGCGAMSIKCAPCLTVSLVERQCRARDEKEFCGDSMTFFKNSDNRFFALISDGMGSGRDAAAISEICAAFISNMLDAGGMNEELLELLNGFLCGRCDGSLCECSATLDLMELDLVSGNTVFFKSGAAASYVYRDGGLFKLRCRTMPIGILERTDTKRFDFKLSAGDVVVMMSDGVSGGKDECPWLYDLLRQNLESSGLERTADLIMKYAVGHGSRDDISLAIMQIA